MQESRASCVAAAGRGWFRSVHLAVIVAGIPETGRIAVAGAISFRRSCELRGRRRG